MKRISALLTTLALCLVVVPHAEAAATAKCTLTITPKDTEDDTTITVQCTPRAEGDRIDYVTIKGADWPDGDDTQKVCQAHSLIWTRVIDSQLLNEDLAGDEIYVEARMRTPDARLYYVKTNEVSGKWGVNVYIGEPDCGHLP
ncbi:hypothetical protein GT755_11025 [Herbidospora sp. NEAU-GS84]|uniref:Subtilisin inhibitor domain-containing protein n=1 Tax=Herbidospora solisilvae TaxID=2696284 RepID=A0A7C9NDU6_9ACTN|nr:MULTISPECIES: hypothetical protein [Herbidospora]NAS22215.1 hypothetical protein [Herbidospora solisilvae]GLX96539.1 hypothetical protein Hesp01_44890 [Herbidospora sp. NBRC 101105]